MCVHIAVKMHKQQNSYDCGIFALAILRCLVTEKPIEGITQAFVTEYRKQVLSELINGALEPFAP